MDDKNYLDRLVSGEKLKADFSNLKDLGGQAYWVVLNVLGRFTIVHEEKHNMAYKLEGTTLPKSA